MEILDQSENIIEPLTFAEGEIDIFIRDHTCSCGFRLVKFPAPERMWTAYCFGCNQTVIESGYMRKRQAEQVEQHTLEGMRELAEPVKRSQKQALSELGF